MKPEVDVDVRDPRTFAIIGAAMEVHRNLGAGFLEAVYQEALTIEFESRGLPFLAQVQLPISYQGQVLKTHYRADFLCFESVLVEIKALNQLTGVEESQILNYLKASNHEVGLIINFGAPSLEHRRFVNKWTGRG
jgi:GxxExxY protein